MVDTWATVGSCAQIGADVHLAGGVGVGGVLEPVQARPVIVEDGAFIGSRCILTEGVLIGERAVLAPNVSLTGSVPVIDVTGAGAGRAPRLRAAALGRRARHAAEGVSRRDVPGRLRADHRLAQRADRSEDVAQRRPARVSRSARPGAPSGSHRASLADGPRSRWPSRQRRGRRRRGARAGRRPGKCTSTSPSPCVAAATATALVPDAVVSPTPRSQTRAVTSPGPSTRTTWTFVRFGKARMRLEQRADLADPCRVADHDRVRVADGDRRQLDAGDASRARPTSTAPELRLVQAVADAPHVAPSRGPTRTRATSLPVRAISQAAAMRVPLPGHLGARAVRVHDPDRHARRRRRRAPRPRRPCRDRSTPSVEPSRTR